MIHYNIGNSLTCVIAQKEHAEGAKNYKIQWVQNFTDYFKNNVSSKERFFNA